MRLEFVEGKSRKFWEIVQNGAQTVVTYGKIGSSGQTSEKDHGSVEKAKKFYDSQINSKLKSGYKELGAATATGSSGNQSSIGHVELPGAAYERFELKQFEFRLDADGKTIWFSLDTIEPPKPLKKAKKAKKSKKDDDDDQDDDDGGDDEDNGDEDDDEDWKSKNAWDNYGPCFMIDDAELQLERKLDLNALPSDLTIADADGYPVYCCDHQDAKNLRIQFTCKLPGNKYSVVWSGDIVMDGDDTKLYPFRIVGNAKHVENDDGDGDGDGDDE